MTSHYESKTAVSVLINILEGRKLRLPTKMESRCARRQKGLGTELISQSLGDRRINRAEGGEGARIWHMCQFGLDAKERQRWNEFGQLLFKQILFRVVNQQYVNP